MDGLLILIWFLLAVGLFFALFASAYFIYVRGGEKLSIFAKLILAFIIYILITAGSGFVAGFIVYIGAHTDPIGSVLTAREVAVGCGFLVIYAAVGWLLCSFIVGRLIWPVRTPLR